MNQLKMQMDQPTDFSKTQEQSNMLRTLSEWSEWTQLPSFPHNVTHVSLSYDEDSQSILIMGGNGFTKVYTYSIQNQTYKYVSEYPTKPEVHHAIEFIGIYQPFVFVCLSVFFYVVVVAHNFRKKKKSK